MNRGDQERLMRYLDGECATEEEVVVERWLSGSPEARALVAELTATGDAVRDIAQDAVLRSESIADAVMANLPQASRAPLGAARSRAWLAWGPAAGLALAAAASFAVHVQHEPAPALAPIASAVHAAPAVLASAESTEDEGSRSESGVGASIESVDFGANNGTIFVVSSGPEETPVVWLMDDQPPDGDRVAPL